MQQQKVAKMNAAVDSMIVKITVASSMEMNTAKRLNLKALHDSSYLEKEKKNHQPLEALKTPLTVSITLLLAMKKIQTVFPKVKKVKTFALLQMKCLLVTNLDRFLPSRPISALTKSTA
jgi:hypothetical protein